MKYSFYSTGILDVLQLGIGVVWNMLSSVAHPSNIIQPHLAFSANFPISTCKQVHLANFQPLNPIPKILSFAPRQKMYFRSAVAAACVVAMLAATPD